jgi:archaeal type IV pilus assembly protein PilA
MNWNSRNGKKWSRAAGRKATKRGVSPIIATILLVAITVVLAAVLYVLISGLTSSTASAPVTLAPALVPGGAGSSGTGSTAIYYVAVGINPSSSIATSAVGLKVTTSTSTANLAAVAGAGCTVNSAYTAGTTCTRPTGTGTYFVVLTNGTGKIVATYSTAGWSSSISLSGGSFVLNVISSAAYDGAGYKLTAYGSGSTSVSGSVNL